MNEAIIIFVRKPELGKVKTRLAASLGIEKALEIYKELLLHTRQICERVKADKFVYYHEQIEQNDLWDASGFDKKIQANAELGEKMLRAFTEVFDAGYKKVLIIGSDCLQLTDRLITEALSLLDKNDTVVGPAKDGGYYLLGMKNLHNFLFENKTWSSNNVFDETMKNAEDHQLNMAVLPMLTDVDTEADWIASKTALHDL